MDKSKNQEESEFLNKNDEKKNIDLEKNNNIKSNVLYVNNKDDMNNTNDKNNINDKNNTNDKNNINDTNDNKVLLIEENRILVYICRNSRAIFYINLGIISIFFVLLLFFTIEYNSNLDYKFWINQIVKYFIILFMQFAMSTLVVKYNVKVNYTRKVIHMSYFLFPQLLDKVLLKYEKDKYTEIWNVWIILFLLLVVSEEIRKKIPFINFLFKSIDRPEDKPYTLIWFSSQILWTLIVLIPFSVYYSKIGKINLIFIPILVNALADGLAEPIGVRYGEHKYKTKGCLSKKEYERSYEGSMCVFIVTLIILLCYIPYMYINQVIFCIMSIPLATTITEATSPHTWDSPLITLVVCSLLTVSIFMDD
jgi:phytol kinase